MKYFFDTEFIEGFHRPFLGRKRHFIDLISIGIVAEDGRTYYAVSKDFDPGKADKWVCENVLNKMVQDFYGKDGTYHFSHGVSAPSIYDVMRNLGKSNKQIATEIFQFINPALGFHMSRYSNSELRPGGRLDAHFTKHNVTAIANIYYAQPEFYAYYADYDWVVFCSLFGRMINLPLGFPMYCRDLKQSFDELAEIIIKRIPDGQPTTENWSKAKVLKLDGLYPQQQNEHNALADAKWNYELYKFICDKQASLK